MRNELKGYETTIVENKIETYGVVASLSNEEVNEVSERLINWTFEPFVQN